MKKLIQKTYSLDIMRPEYVRHIPPLNAEEGTIRVTKLSNHYVCKTIKQLRLHTRTHDDARMSQQLFGKKADWVFVVGLLSGLPIPERRLEQS